MKTLFIFIIGFCFSFSAFSQDTSVVDTAVKKFSIEMLEERMSENFALQEVKPTLFYIEEYVFSGVTVVLNGKRSLVEKAWKKYLKENNNVSIKKQQLKSLFTRKKLNYWKAKQVYLTDVSDKYGDLITVFQRQEGMTRVTMIFKLGYNVSLDSISYTEDFTRLSNYVQKFGDLQFKKNYAYHMKTLKKAAKTSSRELCKESKTLKKMERSYKRKYTKKDKKDDFIVLSIDVQRKLTEMLKAEKNGYEYLMLQYKTRNSEIRSKMIK